MRGNSPEENLGYRRGVVLGLTIAEIILLILFAIVLAMTGVLIKRQAATVTAIETRMAAQQLPKQVILKLESMHINLATPEGESRLLGILDTATKNPQEQEKACRLGVELQTNLGEGITANHILKNQASMKEQIDLLKGEAAKCAPSQILPPCYQSGKNDPVPFIFDIFIKNDGLILRESVPDRFRARFETDFRSFPPSRTLSDREFASYAKPFTDYGKRHQCKFYVKVYDETGNNRERVRQQLKIIEVNFVWTFMMAGKTTEQSESINLFPVAPSQLK